MVQGEIDRETIKARLFAEVEQFIANFDTFETVLDEPEKRYISKKSWLDGDKMVYINKYHCDGLTEETIMPVFDSCLNLIHIVRNRMEPEQLEDDQGHRLWHVKMYMPMMMTNRSAIVCEYKGQTSDGLNIMVMSS